MRYFKIHHSHLPTFDRKIFCSVGYLFEHDGSTGNDVIIDRNGNTSEALDGVFKLKTYTNTYSLEINVIFASSKMISIEKLNRTIHKENLHIPVNRYVFRDIFNGGKKEVIFKPSYDLTEVVYKTVTIRNGSKSGGKKVKLEFVSASKSSKGYRVKLGKLLSFKSSGR